MTLADYKLNVDHSYRTFVEWLRGHILNDNPWPDGIQLFYGADANWKLGITATSDDKDIARPDIYLVKYGLNTPDHPMLFGTDREYNTGTRYPVLAAGRPPRTDWTEGKLSVLLRWPHVKSEVLDAHASYLKAIYDFTP